MSRPEEIHDRLTNVHQIGAIISALRAIASARQAEAKARVQAIRAQEEAVAEALSAALALGDAPKTQSVGPGVAIVIGASQGFSGSYAEHMAEAARNAADQGDALIVVGARTIGALMDSGQAMVWTADLAARSEDIPELAIHVADALYERLAKTPESPVRIIHTDPDDLEAGPQSRALIPFDTNRFPHSARSAPIINLAPAELLSQLIEEYVFTEICEVLMLGYAAENAARAEAMSRAQTAVKEMAGGLQQEFQRARQEQMTTEIVELATAAEAVSDT